MKRQRLLVLLQQNFPEFSKKELYAKILCGEVSAEGQRLRDPKELLASGTRFSLLKGRRYVSRGGNKLDKAIEVFGPLGFFSRAPRAELIILDAGASSGGFSDCLLQYGCGKIYAVDSGKNQLDFKLRRDPRVHSFEGCNIQNFIVNLPSSGLQSPDFVVMDISFRSILPLIPPSLAACRSRSGVFLCKPQFEWKAFCRAFPPYQKEDFCGIVGDEISSLVRNWFCWELEEAGVEILGSCLSPIRGGKGNLEFLFYLRYLGESDGRMGKV
ncbi:MAG: SAM-dependent methyltransferase [Spirochaetota bacterium]